MPTKTATLVKSNLPNFHGVANLYKCEPPTSGGHEHVVVSAVSGHVVETYIFPADERGEVVDWCELEGSYRGGVDHAEALRGAGYEVA